jgi:hypothetical protein
MFARVRNRWFALPAGIRLAVGVWALLLVAVCVRVAVSRPTAQTVLPIYLAAGERWAGGETLYVSVPGLDVYRNPPGFAATFAPLTLLPAKLVGILWRLAGTGVFLLGLHRFRRALAPDWGPTRVGLLFALAALLAVPALNNGQVNLLLAGAALNGTAAALGRRWWESAAWFALGGWLKVYPLALGLLVSVAAPLRLGPRLVLLALLAAGLPWLLQDPAYVLAQYRGFVDWLGLDDRHLTIPQRAARDWTILPRTWSDWIVPADVSRTVSAAAGIAAALAVAVAALRATDPRRPLALALALGRVWMTAFGPATEANTYTVLAGTAAFLAVAPQRRFSRLLALAGCGLLAVSVLRGLFQADWQFQVLGPQPVGAMLLALAALTAGPARVLEPGRRIWLTRVTRRTRLEPAPAAGLSRDA